MKAIIYRCEWINEKENLALINIEEITIPKKNRLKFLQKTVGGLIEVYNYKGKDLIFDEEGLFKNYPPNLHFFNKGIRLFGTVIELQGTLLECEKEK